MLCSMIFSNYSSSKTNEGVARNSFFIAEKGRFFSSMLLGGDMDGFILNTK